MHRTVVGVVCYVFLHVTIVGVVAGVFSHVTVVGVLLRSLRTSQL